MIVDAPATKRFGNPALPPLAAHIAVVMVNFRTPELTLEALSGLDGEREYLPNLRVIVLENGSGDNSASILTAGLAAEKFSDWAELRVSPINGGFGWANNQAILEVLNGETPPDYVYLLNPDALVEPGALVRLVERLAATPRAAAVGSQLVEPDGRLAGSAFRFPTISREFVRGSKTQLLGRLLGIAPMLVASANFCRADWVTGASVLLRSAALREVGLFDDGFFLYFEEVELMHRLTRAGWEMWHDPTSRVVHIGGASTGVVSGVQQATKPMPTYWFESRRRYFARTSGRSSARLASLAWLAGHALGTIRKWIKPGRAIDDIPFELRDFLAHGLSAHDADLAAAIPDFKTGLGKPPAWTLKR
jgi:N-acetylglucosaminyl-diphospho-decaprenol L-rhamnosyltransferase